MGKRSKRLTSFLQPSGAEVVIPFAESLVKCAFAQLEMAFKNRLSETAFTAPDNHASPHVLGSLVLLVSALEAWLNECILIMHVEDKSKRKVVECTIPKKFEALSREAAGATMQVHSDLQLVLDVRNEIVHSLPGLAIPTWLEPLDSRALMIKAQNLVGVDFTLHQKLSSYRLAVWSWHVVSEHVARLLALLGASSVESATFVANSRHDIFSSRLFAEKLWWIESGLSLPSYDFWESTSGSGSTPRS